jgi:hypothetical protein
MKTIQETIKESGSYKSIMNIVNANKRVIDREKEIGFDNIEEKAMGSGGVGQIKIIKGFVFVQIESGHGRHNYAKCANLGHVHKSELYHENQFVENSNLVL